MFSLLFRGSIFLIVSIWYTVSVWNIINTYFNTEFKKYLKEVFESNKYTTPDYIDKQKNTINTRTIQNQHCKLEQYLLADILV